MISRGQTQNLKSMLFVLAFFTLVLAAFMLGCGSRRSDGGGSSGQGGPINDAFHRTSAEFAIPVKLLKAVAFYESDMNADDSSVPYLNTGSDEDRRQLGFGVTETAFGVPLLSLNLVDAENANTLPVQIAAYGKWVRENIAASDQLAPSLTSPTDYYHWLWQLAKLHRGTDGDGRNIQAVWANGLIDILNQGRTWQNAADTEKVELVPVTPVIDKAEFPVEAQALFQLVTSQGEIFNSQMFPLYQHPNTLPNAPTHVKVVHCPMSLSACLEIQNIRSDKDTARLRAHFIIPPFETDSSGMARQLAFQVTPMAYAVELTDSQGDLREVNDAVVVMLTGKSGRYVNGQRLSANPAWYTPRQLQVLGAVVKDICQKLSRDNEQINSMECRTPRHTRGVQFHAQGPLDPTYKWGDIPDFEETIFEAYIRANDSLTEGEAEFEFHNRSKRYPAMQEFSFDVRFTLNVQYIAIERAVRCPGGKIIWAPLTSSQVHGRDSKTFRTEIHDGGPNNNGETYLRAKVYDDSNKLIAWSIDQVLIYNFDPELRPVYPDACRRSGT